ncbi:MAG TPA: 50S ribosomal protein L35ae [Candidatus Bathyarchaeia archaeon]
MGRKVVLKYGKNNLIGRIMGLHGKKDVVTAKFHKNIPEQAIGERVRLSG